ncbi:MAG: ATP-binding protein [Ekhidna sp.]|uniref:ATP-binding protein n=1 Tax=Ekhidna sp. TaxID=2608089 RepID=UPI003299D81A
MTIDEIKNLRETEDKVEFKQATTQYNYNNGRRSVLGYIVALANEKGGKLILGVTENPNPPHIISGSQAFAGREGQLEQDIYRDLQIRVQTEVLHEGNNRVLVIHIGSRPIGRYLTFQDVPLMRVGEDLHPMNQDQIRTILLEQESDFSATICDNIGIQDLDTAAIAILKSRYADKQNNKIFIAQSNEQVLSDLDLLQDGRLTHAALILLGKREVIRRHLPQCSINLEYRSNPDSIQFDKRDTFTDPYFVLIDELWKIIDARNKKKHIQIGSYIIDIPELNDEVIRESINNAVAHRDYSKASEIIIKHSPHLFSVSSHGGFPLGVEIENILTVNSTPRNRLLADVLTKTGLVERSGQGVDKIFYQTLSEGKDSPSYSDSDLFQVTVKIPVVIKYPVFALFIRNIQKGLEENEKLGVNHMITLARIREHKDLNARDKELIPRLIDVGAVTESKDGVILSDRYTELVEELEGTDTNKIIEFIKVNAPVKMGDILALFSHRLTRRQVNNMVFKLVDEKVIASSGKGTATTYSLKE